MTVCGYEFRDEELAGVALTTPSYRMTCPSAKDNQRLEYLGDAVLGLLAADWLYAANPSSAEGDLTARRQHMVSSAALCKAANGSGLAALQSATRGRARSTRIPRRSRTRWRP